MNIAGLQRFTLSDFPGRTAAIVFTQGCNFRCPYCHNRQLWHCKSDTVAPIPQEKVLTFLAERRGYLKGLVITGGEPTLQVDLPVFIRKVKKLGLGVKLDTNGSRPEIVERLFSEALIDYIAMDVKAPFAKYDLLCGRTVDHAAIRKSIGLIAASPGHHHFRTTFYRALLSETDLQLIKDMLPPYADFHIQPCRDVH